MIKEEKRFLDWIKLKSELHYSASSRTIKEGEVWWAALGENVGVEINGKSDTFARPVVVFKKLSRFGFLAIPLTSQVHTGTWYAHFIFKNKDQYAVLAQLRVLSTSRLYKKIGTLPESDLCIVKDAFKRLYCE